MPETENTNSDTSQDTSKETSETFADFEAYLAKQAEPVKKLYETHTQGLKSALETERTSRKEAERQLRELAKKAESGSEAQKQLTEMAERMATTERMNQFYATAHAAGVKNLRLAYLAASEAKLISEQGEVDFAKMKESYPELFAAAQSGQQAQSQETQTSTANAGGTQRLTREAIEKMTPDEINRNWEAVSAALAEQT